MSDSINETATSNPKQSLRETLGDRMKQYEAATSIKIDASLPFIIRLDGHAFSKFTSQLKKPYDVRMHEGMLQTSIDLMNVFKPTTVYTCSDEITMLFPSPTPGLDAVDPGQEGDSKKSALMYSGKVQKLASLSASYASTSFYIHMMGQEAVEPELKEYIQKKRPHFDARVFNVPSNEELVHNIVWRNHFDYRRNAVSILGHFLLTEKQHGVNNAQLLEMLAARGIHWDDQPLWYRFGSFVKKEQHQVPLDPSILAVQAKARAAKQAKRERKLAAANKATTTAVATATSSTASDEATTEAAVVASTPSETAAVETTTTRTRPVVLHFDMSGLTDDNLSFLCGKYYSGTLPTQPPRPKSTATSSTSSNDDDI